MCPVRKISTEMRWIAASSGTIPTAWSADICKTKRIRVLEIILMESAGILM